MPTQGRVEVQCYPLVLRTSYYTMSGMPMWAKQKKTNTRENKLRTHGVPKYPVDCLDLLTDTGPAL